MNRILRCLPIFLLVFSTPGLAQEQSHAQHSRPSGTPEATHHAFLAAERQTIERGEGFGMAMVADHNGYPGPRHVLDLKNELQLTADQKAAMEKLFAEMKGKALSKGRDLLEAEDRLDRMFAEGRPEPELREQAFRAATLRAELRWVHLGAHLQARKRLNKEQLTEYKRLRFHSGMAAGSEEGFVTTPDGVRLYYQKMGSGKQTVIVPARLFLFEDFKRLAKGRTLIFYDMRNRGRSDAVEDPKRITIHDDVEDLEAVRQHFGVEKADLIGFSYLGMMVVLYATQHPDHVGRIVQLGPVPRKFPTEYPASLTAQDQASVPDPAKMKELDELEKNGYIREHPKEFCEREWEVTRVRLVGDPSNVSKLGPGLCSMPNEWPVHLWHHFEIAVGSVRTLDFPREKVARLRVPVLTIHGAKDRNAPYGSGREWAMTLPKGRLITVPGAAHMSWVEAPDLVFTSIDTFLGGKWPAAAEKVTQLEVTNAKQETR